jgi:hypothetical protein
MSGNRIKIAMTIARFITSGNFPSHRFRYRLHIRHQPLEIIEIEGLGAVLQCGVRAGVDLDYQSAPAATAAMATGLTRYHLPVPWLGSAITGRWLSLLITGMALRSMVFLV